MLVLLALLLLPASVTARRRPRPDTDDFEVEDEDEADDRERTILGYLAAGLSVAFCAAPLFQAGHVIRTRNTESLPFPLIFMTFLVTAQWWLFGVIIDDAFVQYPNMIGCVTINWIRIQWKGGEGLEWI